MQASIFTNHDSWQHTSRPPGESSSGGKSKRTGITKCGNSHARWILVECSTHYSKEPRIGANLTTRQAGLARWIIEKSWKAQNRLYLRTTSLRKRLMHHNKIKVSIARELCGVIWEIGYKLQSNPAKCPQPPTITQTATREP
jgi:hypothetical protein